MPAAHPLFLAEASAAQALSLPKSKFRALVDDGALPAPCKVRDVYLWDVEELIATVRGARPEPDEEFDL